ncbi:MAG TPA: hypothetical protein VIH40_12605, partial [Xanthobacteraceae bacterium]
ARGLSAKERAPAGCDRQDAEHNRDNGRNERPTRAAQRRARLRARFAQAVPVIDIRHCAAPRWGCSWKAQIRAFSDQIESVLARHILSSVIAREGGRSSKHKIFRELLDAPLARGMTMERLDVKRHGSI